MDFACLGGFLKSFLCDYSDSKINLFLCVQSKNHYFITRIKSIFNSCVDFMTSNSCVVFEPFFRLCTSSGLWDNDGTKVSCAILSV